MKNYSNDMDLNKVCLTWKIFVKVTGEILHIKNHLEKLSYLELILSI